MMFVGKKTGPRKRGPKSLSDASARVYPTGHLDEQAPQRSFGTFGYPPVCESATSPPEPAALPWIR